jgi:hypothetical protein
MSSIFSDPFFRRGNTLLSGEVIEYAIDGTTPSQGTEVVGQVKAFQDVLPTGTGERYSNRLVYCVAARYIGSDTTGSVLRRQLVDFSGSKPLTEFGVSGSAASSALSTKTDVANGVTVGVVDEYLADSLPIRKNDIVWVVVKGPTTVAKEAGTGLALVAGNGVVASNTAGAVTKSGAADAGAIFIGEQISGGTAAADATARINLWSNRI